jgi:hypothetical protein
MIIIHSAQGHSQRIQFPNTTQKKLGNKPKRQEGVSNDSTAHGDNQQEKQENKVTKGSVVRMRSNAKPESQAHVKTKLF